MSKSLSVEEIKKMYYDPLIGLMGIAKFLNKLSKGGFTFDKKEATNALKKQELNQILKPIDNSIQFKIVAAPRTFQIDIMFLPDYKKENDGYDKLLVLIDINTRKAYVYPMKTKTMSEIILNYQKFLNDVGVKINGVSGDEEFNKKEFLDLNKKKGINTRFDISAEQHLSAGNKLGIIDRFIRTLRSKITQYIYTRKEARWIDVINDLMKNYNDTPMDTLENNTPNEVFNNFDLMMKLRNKGMTHNKFEYDEMVQKIPIGSKVRALTGKKAFDKEKPRFSEAIYEVTGMDGFRFKVKNKSGDILQRRFKFNELQLVKNEVESFAKPDVSAEDLQENLRKEKRVDKVIQKELGVNPQAAREDAAKERTTRDEEFTKGYNRWRRAFGIKKGAWNDNIEEYRKYLKSIEKK